LVLPGDDVMATSQVARLLGISSTHAIRLADQGQLTAIQTPLGRLYRRQDVERLAEDRQLTSSAAG
jgi:excisionase family DNA binding protein